MNRTATRPPTWDDVTIREYAALALVARRDAADALEAEYARAYASGAQVWPAHAVTVTPAQRAALASARDELAACHRTDVRGHLAVARRVLAAFGTLTVLHASESPAAVAAEARA